MCLNICVEVLFEMTTEKEVFRYKNKHPTDYINKCPTRYNVASCKQKTEQTQQNPGTHRHYI